MARTDDDTWDLASSVGATATMVAAGRALATKSPRKLIDDPFAEPLVEAVGLDFFTKQVKGELDTSDLDAQSVRRVELLVDEVAVRTRFFDDFFLTSTENGVRQAVILASGLDARAYRLAWPPETVVYEIDQPAVIDFKTTTLTRLGAKPTVQLRTVPIDLRGDWPTALRAAGFDADAPSVWSAEGLLMYLPSDAQRQLFDSITGLSAAGSRAAADYVPGRRNLDDAAAQAISEGWQEKGFNLDMPALMFSDESADLVDHLTAQGWQVQAIPRAELFAQNGIQLSNEADDILGGLVYMHARLGEMGARPQREVPPPACGPM